MSEIWMDVDIALASVPVNSIALVDATDFKTIEDAVAFDQAGMALFWNFTTTAGVKTVTAVTPTAAGDYDWTDFATSGMYGIEIPASGGASINNDAEGFGYFTGVATGVLPWRGPTIGFRAAVLNNDLVDAGVALAKASATDTLLDALIMNVTTIATLTSQTSFTLTAGSADNDAYNEATIVVVDAASGVQKAFGSLSDYTGSTKRVILAQDPGIFTMAVGDTVYILPSDSFAILDALLTGSTHNVTNSLARRVRQQQESGTYSLGLVWLDTVGGFVGTTLFENGTEVRPVKTTAEANTILGAATLGLHGCHVAAGSTVTFPSAQDNQEWTGEGWTLVLNGKSIAGTTIVDATVSGISIGVPNALRECFINASTFAGGDFVNCALGDTITLSGATGYHFFDCHHAEMGAPSTIDFGAAVGATEVHLHNWHGNLVIKNMKAGDILHFTCADGKLTLDASCTAGTVNRAGVHGFTNNGSGQTINDIGVGSLGADLTVVDAIADEIKAAVITNAAGDDVAADIIALKAETVLILEDTDELQSDDIPATLATIAGFIDTEIATLLTNVAAILVDTSTTLEAKIDALDDITAAEVLAAGDIDGLSLEEAFKVALAALAGKASGLATNTAIYRAIDNSKARITATVDADGNRTAVTIDATG